MVRDLLTVATAFNVNVYLVPGPHSNSLLNIPKNAAAELVGVVKMLLLPSTSTCKSKAQAPTSIPAKRAHEIIELDSD